MTFSFEYVCKKKVFRLLVVWKFFPRDDKYKNCHWKKILFFHYLGNVLCDTNISQLGLKMKIFRNLLTSYNKWKGDVRKYYVRSSCKSTTQTCPLGFVKRQVGTLYFPHSPNGFDRQACKCEEQSWPKIMKQ